MGVFALFLFGASLNIVLVRIGEEVGPAYLAVAGSEMVVALLLAAVFYGERLGAVRLGAAGLILLGVVILGMEVPHHPVGGERTVVAEDIRTPESNP